MRCKTIRKLLFWENIGLLVLTCLAWGAPLGLSNIVFPILGLVYPVLLLSHMIMILVWLALRSRAILIPLFVILVSWIWLPQVLYLHTGDHTGDHTGRTGDVVVGSWNMQFLKEAEYSDHGLRLYLNEQQDIDILCTQEYGSRTESYIKGTLDFPYQHHIMGTTVSTLSKYPIIGMGQVGDENNPYNIVLWTDIAIDTDTVRVYNAHLESNRHDGIVPEVIEEDSEEILTVNSYFGIIRNYYQFWLVRREQAKDIKRHASTSPYPVLICGDMNEPPMSYIYSILVEGLRDAACVNRRGFDGTHDTLIPGMRIDYILMPISWRLTSFRNVPSDYSDHHLIRAEADIR